MAAWCVAFAAVNLILEGTDHLAQGEYAAYTDAFTVMNWLVAGLKLVGAAVALLSLSRRPPLAPRFLGVLVWGGFTTLGAYALGSVVQLIGLVAGLTDGARWVEADDVGYLLFFLVAAVGWGVLALSYSRRHGLGWPTAMLGALAAPVVLGFLLVVMPMVLTAWGLMPA